VRQQGWLYAGGDTLFSGETKDSKTVEEHFKFRLNRPELFNRIGNNFVVFDYIRPGVMGQIIDKILGNIAAELTEKKKLAVEFAPDVRAFLLQRAAGNIEQGRRGIGNLIETTLLNPLARLIFDRKLSGPRLVVKEIGEKSEWEVVSYFLNIESAE